MKLPRLNSRFFKNLFFFSVDLAYFEELVELLSIYDLSSWIYCDGLYVNNYFAEF